MDILKEALKKFGTDCQKTKAIEELSELIQAICKNDREEIVEEISDVYIILNYIKMIYNIEEKEIDTMINYKLRRLIKRII